MQWFFAAIWAYLGYVVAQVLLVIGIVVAVFLTVFGAIIWDSYIAPRIRKLRGICPRCKGTGRDPIRSFTRLECSDCKGTGKYTK